MINGERRGERYDRVDLPFVFSPDGKRTAYLADPGTGWTAIVDGCPSLEGAQSISDLTWSPDSRRLMYVDHNP
jgi:hypothetical protein